MFSTTEIVDDTAIVRAVWTSDNVFNWTITKEAFNYFSFSQAEVYNQSVIAKNNSMQVKVGEYPFDELAVSSNNVTTNVVVNAYGSPIVVQDPDKGIGYRWLLPTCTLDFDYKGLTGQALFDMRIDCFADSRWRNIFSVSTDPTVFKVELSASEGCELVGNAIHSFFGPLPGFNRFNKFCILMKQVVNVYSLPAVLKLQFTFQVDAVQKSLKAYKNVPIYTDFHLNWRSYLGSFGNSREFENSSIDLAGSSDVEYEFLAMENA